MSEPERDRERNRQPLARRRGYGGPAAGLHRGRRRRRCAGPTSGTEWFPNTPVGENRADRTRSLRSLGPQPGHHALWASAPELVVVNEARQTNAQLYDYQRTRGELRFVRQF